MVNPLLDPRQPRVVGSIGTSASLAEVDAGEVRSACDIVEIRLDLLDREAIDRRSWRRFGDMPLLFTARCETEGGAPGLDADERIRRLRAALDEASIVDIELASADTMQLLIDDLAARDIPWLASFHDFTGTPGIDELESRQQAARQAGASGFKAAVDLGWEANRLGPLALFLSGGGDFPVSLMGMGPLASASRLLFAQLGSVLNYGYLGDTPTAPGQWSARQLKEAIESVAKER